MALWLIVVLLVIITCVLSPLFKKLAQCGAVAFLAVSLIVGLMLWRAGNTEDWKPAEPTHTTYQHQDLGENYSPVWQHECVDTPINKRVGMCFPRSDEQVARDMHEADPKHY